ncbi:MAG: cytochrome c maturation protein CcmE [Chthonomonadales bacterium]|nr:cytochrome c maturation protein CcmE [Chthonomonadales bacterium]
MKPAHIIAFSLLLISACVTLFSFSQATAPHVSIPQARAMPGKVVQVPGQIDHSSVSFTIHGTQSELKFDITDMQGSKDRMTVVYRKPKPENFANATSVEAIGRYSDNAFQAHTLLVKCPSKYEGADPARPAPAMKNADRTSAVGGAP